jgi:1-acyl-sn-glycerol-3-phosphate acyltransferase
MHILKGTLLLLAVFAYIFFGLLIHLFIIFLKPSFRHRLISNCSRLLAITIKNILGIKLRLEGELSYSKENGNFIVANHQGYLDGIILSSLFPVIFVTKLQVKSWPVFGWMSQVGSTIFIDRKRKLGAMDFVAKISDMLKEKINVLFFPEGTSTDGSRILPFQQGYFQAPINSGSTVIPVTIQYTKINSQDISAINRDKVFWYGQVKFAEHLFEVLRQKEIEVRIIIHPKIETSAYDFTQASSRKELSEAALQAIAGDFTPIK